MPEITVMQSAAFKPAYLQLVPQFERETGHRVKSLWVSTAKIMPTLESGAPADMVIASAACLDALIAKSLARSRVDLARCGVGVAVRAGAPRPDISSGEALKRTVLAADSIVYSLGPSGVYLEGLFERMGIAREIAHKVKRVQGEPAGDVVARGEAQIGFQQMSELMPVAGIDLVGPLSGDVQEITTFSAGELGRVRELAAAHELIEFFRTDAARTVIRATGMDPV